MLRSWTSTMKCAVLRRCPEAPSLTFPALAPDGRGEREMVAKRARYTPLLESTGCGNRPVRRAFLASLVVGSRAVPGTPPLAFGLRQVGTNAARGATSEFSVSFARLRLRHVVPALRSAQEIADGGIACPGASTIVTWHAPGLGATSAFDVSAVEHTTGRTHSARK